MEGSAPDPNQAQPEWDQSSFDDYAQFNDQNKVRQVPKFIFCLLNQ